LTIVNAGPGAVWHGGRSAGSRAPKGDAMGLIFLGFFWFAGVAVATALPLVLGGRRAVVPAFGIAVACLLALQGLYSAAQAACATGGCGDLGPLLDHIRMVLATLTVLGLVTGLGAGWLIPGRGARREG
jgi:hypothetical protein